MVAWTSSAVSVSASKPDNDTPTHMSPVSMASASHAAVWYHTRTLQQHCETALQARQ